MGATFNLQPSTFNLQPSTGGRHVRGSLGFWIKLVVSVVLIAWLLYQENPVRVADLASHANPWLLGLSFLLYLVAISAGAYKWGVLLVAQGVNIPLFQLVRSTFLGLFFGNFLPSNVGGDVVRAYDLSRSIDPAVSSASVIVDRLVGLMVFIGSAAVMGVIAVLWLGHPALWNVALASAALFVGCSMVFVALLSRRVAKRGAFVFELIPRLHPLKATAKRIADAFHAYRSRLGAVAWVAVVSFGIQCLTSVVNWLIGVALGLDVPFVYYFIFNPLVAFILLIPITINGIGLKQAVYVFFYSTLTGRVEESQALTLSILMHANIIGSGLLGGVFFLQSRSETKGQLVMNKT